MTARPDNTGYNELLRIGKAATENSRNLPEVRIALLADHAAQQFIHALAASVLEQGLFPVIYATDYGTAALQAYDADSELHGFKPEFAVYSISVQKYRDRFYSETSAAARNDLPQNYLNEALGIVHALLERGVRVIINNFALPIERMFGNYSALTAQSLYGSVLRFNALLAEAVAGLSDCRINDVMYISSRVGAQDFFDERLWSASKYLCANRYLPDLTRSIARIVSAQKGRLSKVLVLDLDNTLWGGVIGDDGMDGIALGGDAYGESFQMFQRYILSLKNRGYVLAVCSKNNEETALEVFRSHPEMILREEDISVFVANWNDKASNIEYISRVLNLGLDSFIFIDDNPFERNLVKAALPDVKVPEMPDDVADFVHALESSGELEATGYTDEDTERNRKYREEALRTVEQVKYGGIDDYLKSLDIRIQCGPFRPDDLPRIAQLIQRSNQFNFRTQRFSQGDCENHMGPDCVSVAARLRDRFGDYGLIAVICCEIRDNKLFVAEFVMSCRVLKRGVEEYLVNHLFAECRKRGLEGILGEYIASPKNAMVKDFYKSFGFNGAGGDETRRQWYLETDRYEPRITFIKEEEQA